MVRKFSEEKRTQFHLHVTVTLCNIHHRPFFRPYPYVHRSWFLFRLFSGLLLIAAKDFGTSKKTLPPFQNLDSLQAADPPGNCWENSLQRGRKQLLKVCMQQTVLESDTGYTIMHTSSLHATATPNRD